ncbi:MAG: type II secretion system F family protein [Deferribacterales bacterium]
MPFFIYDGVDSQGKPAKGQIEAQSRNAALSKLMAEGVLVSSISDVLNKKRALFFSFSSKKNTADIFFQLSIMLTGGIPLTKALTVTSETLRDKRMKRALLDICAKVSSGMRFSDAMKEQDGVFSELYIHLIRTSEKVGRLPQVLLDISRFEEERRKAGEKIVGAMIYPSVVLTLGFAVVTFMLAYVVPRLQDIFKSAGAEIPAATKLLLLVSSFLQVFGLPLFLILLVCLGVFLRAYRKKGSFRLNLDKKLYRITIIKDVTAARLSHVLGFQLKEGLPLVEALRNCAGSIGNAYVSEGIRDIADSVASGKKFSDSVNESGLFSELFSAAAATGEKSGSLYELMEHVNIYYSRKTEQFTARFVSVVEPVFIMFIGIVVGFIVISIMEPLFSINSLVK